MNNLQPSGYFIHKQFGKLLNGFYLQQVTLNTTNARTHNPIPTAPRTIKTIIAIIHPVSWHLPMVLPGITVPASKSQYDTELHVSLPNSFASFGISIQGHPGPPQYSPFPEMDIPSTAISHKKNVKRSFFYWIKYFYICYIYLFLTISIILPL